MNNDELKSRSLRFSLWDGVFASLMTGFTQDYFAPFLISIGGSNTQIGVLSALSNLFSSLSQLKSSLAVRLFSRRSVILFLVYLQALALIPIVLLTGFPNPSPVIFIILAVLFSTSGAFSLPAWGSLMADLLDEDKRGQYFGWRGSILGLFLVACSFAAGAILNFFKNRNPMTGFCLIFSLACAARLGSWYFLTRMHDPAPGSGSLEKEAGAIFNRHWRESNFLRFVFFISALNFSLNVAGPFYTVLMLRDLKFSYLLYTCIILTSTLTTYLMMKSWGSLADRIGNIKVIKFTSRYVSLLPLLWVLTQKPQLLFFFQVIGGFVYAGYNLAVSNFVYDSSPAGSRTGHIAFYNAATGTSACLGALFGTFIIHHLPPIDGNPILSVIFLSALLRIFVVFLFPYKPAEVRKVEKMHSYEIFRTVTGLKLLPGHADRGGSSG
ncbi:MAG: MFS transporter [Candidatus Wallbacteria bacterium]|nr:MFS transporter [Candidatus Wallbacteria bacterium]